jgi:2-deoxy-D-gluconate 3-dehydrogenase
MSKVSFSLTGKTAVVTGAKRGIGKAIALAFAEVGADVAICGRTTDDGGLAAVAAEIEKLGRRCFYGKADISNREEVERFIGQTTDKFGAIDILVNNGGLNNKGLITELPEAEWDKLMDVDLKGCFLCSQAVAKGMIARRKGSIINITSRMAHKGVAERGAYCVAKAGVEMLTRVMAQELGQFGVRANSIAPGTVQTDFNRSTWTDPVRLAKSEAQIPMGRIGQVDDMLGAAIFLASDASSYISGISIMLDGGRSA